MRSGALARLAGVACLALVVVAAAVAAGPGEDPGPAADAPVKKTTLFDGIPQNGIALGSPDAPVVLTEFADLQCPFCAVYAREILPMLVDRYVRPGRIRLELRVLTFLGEDSVRGGAMAAAAARQDRLWPFTEAFYRSQGAENTGYATDEFMRRIGAATPDLDIERAFGDRARPEVLELLGDADRAARTLRVDHTPAFYVRRGDGPARPIEPSALTAEAFMTALDEALSSY